MERLETKKIRGIPITTTRNGTGLMASAGAYGRYTWENWSILSKPAYDFVGLTL